MTSFDKSDIQRIAAEIARSEPAEESVNHAVEKTRAALEDWGDQDAAEQCIRESVDAIARLEPDECTVRAVLERTRSMLVIRMSV